MVYRTYENKAFDRFLEKFQREAILVVGTRKAKVPTGLSNQEFEEEATRENFNPHVNLSNIFFHPLKIGAMMMFGCIY